MTPATSRRRAARRAFYIQYANGQLVKTESGVAIPYPAKTVAFKVAKSVGGTVACFNWITGKLVPVPVGTPAKEPRA